MRHMSFAWTTPQLLRGEKTVTRRMGWDFLKSGDHVCAVEKAMGLKKGERMKRLAILRIVSVRRERVDAILDQPEDCAREGFPDMTTFAFVTFFCTGNRCLRSTVITRIEFEVLEYLVPVGAAS